MPKFEKGHKRVGGRQKGTPNKATKAFNEALVEIMDEPKTLEKLRELRDSEEPADRATFWRVAGKRVPAVIEAKVEHAVRLNLIDLSDERDTDEPGND